MSDIFNPPGTDANLPAQAPNTVLTNPTSSTAAPQAVSVARFQKQVGAIPAYQIVGTRCGINGPGGQFTGGVGMEGRIQTCLPFGALDIYPLYAGFYMTTSSPDKEVPLNMGNGYYATGAVSVGGSGYVVGDTVIPAVATNQTSPTISIDAVNGGVPTECSILEGGMFNAIPATGLAQASTLTKAGAAGAGTGATFTLVCQACPAMLHCGLEQVWGTQSAFSATNLTGVLKLFKGANFTGVGGNIALTTGAFLALDPVQVDAAAGALLGNRFWSPGDNLWTGRYTLGSANVLNEEVHDNIPAESTAPPWGGTYPSRSNPGAGFQPFAMMGRLAVPMPSFVGIGDSIFYGTISLTNATTSHDALDANGNGGWFERAINQSMPWTNIATPSDRLANWMAQPSLTTGAGLRMMGLEIVKPSHVIDALGINDVVGGAATFASLQAWKIKFWSWLVGIDVKEIWVPTLTPNTTSTDGWVTTANQTVTAANTAIQLWNQWLLGGNAAQYGVTKVLAFGTVVETVAPTASTPGSGIWPANATGDGLHPLQATVPTMAALFPATFAAATL